MIESLMGTNTTPKNYYTFFVFYTFTVEGSTEVQSGNYMGNVEMDLELTYGCMKVFLDNYIAELNKTRTTAIEKWLAVNIRWKEISVITFQNTK